MNKATKAITLVLVGSGAVLLGYTAFAPRHGGYGGYSSTQPSSYHGGSRSRWGYSPFFFRGSSGSSSYRSTSSGSSGSYSGTSHSSGSSRGGFGSSGRSVS